MSETSEAEVLKAVAVEAWNDGPTTETENEWLPRVAAAVAAKARALDRARGGVLSAEEVEEKLEIAAEAGHARKMASIRAHLAAQGRTIAALGAQFSRLRDGLWALGVATEYPSEPGSAVDAALAHVTHLGATIAAKDARIAELEAEVREAKYEAQEENAHKRHALTEKAAAESALATLRQATGDLCGLLREDMADSEPTRLGEKTLFALTYAEGALHATPAEHPDTAALPGIYKRTRDLHRRWFHQLPERVRDYVSTSCWHAARWAVFGDKVLGDSGPSGGGDASAEVATCAHGVPTAFWCIPCKFPTPTTPPDVAASEREEDPHAAHLLREMEAAERCRQGQHVAQGPAAGDGAGLCGHCGTDTTKPTPTPEEDWRTVDDDLATAWLWALEKGGTAMAARFEASRKALARLRDEPRRAAERMRERCAELCHTRKLHMEEAASSARNSDRAMELRERSLEAHGLEVAIRALEVSP